MSDPLALKFFKEEAAASGFVAGAEAGTESAYADESWLIGGHAVITSLLTTLGCVREPTSDDDILFFCSLICSREFDDVVDRMALVDALHATAPGWRDHVIQHALEIINSPDAGPGDRLHAAESLLDFGGEHLPHVAESLRHLASDATIPFDDRFAAADALGELGAPYRDQARRLIRDMTGEPRVLPQQRHELSAHLVHLTDGNETPPLKR
jgi:hypothetical protein